ncbi:YitT family protein [Enterococcus faecium]|uniref:YitT family protein n=1 Tax=Enterococcus faecium TaxID=1352 RepID=UPI0018E79039|nr:YitT family protein [Enterococcus faecium]MBJ2300913.1 YitT family protein [Enterococcus faecium]QQF97158.1 YitT family protein [Enterococcus faecium]QQG11715.1 YitT family protein [Enterococcus faecium]QQG23315.1 YitT family protein [Enterococcus faecium]QQG26091.1 YitT family protein [Enterococcus faecium]
MKKLNLFTELCGIILGAGIYGLAVTGINIPSKLADGGVTGIALLLHNLFGFAPSVTSLLFNLPLLLISLFLFGKHAFLRTIVGTFALVFFLHLWESLHIHFAVDSLLINSLMTGILSGIGCGLVFRFGGSTGGTDIIYQAIEKYFHIKIGKSLFLITFGILVVSLLYLDLTHLLYTLLSCSILSYTLNKVKYLEIGSVLPQLEAKQTTETFEPLDPLEQLEH